VLQQQEEEHVALLLQHSEAVAASRSTYRMVMLRVQQPLVSVMSCTMPRARSQRRAAAQVQVAKVRLPLKPGAAAVDAVEAFVSCLQW